jgi:hypothetical protein
MVASYDLLDDLKLAGGQGHGLPALSARRGCRVLKGLNNLGIHLLHLLKVSLHECTAHRILRWVFHFGQVRWDFGRRLARRMEHCCILAPFACK